MADLGHWTVDPCCSIDPLFFNFPPVHDYQKYVENMLSFLPVDVVICVFCLSFILIEVLAIICGTIILLRQTG
jgi:hypothetical protein